MLVNTLCIFGTRPEAIKMAPLLKQLNAHPNINSKLCVTGQHEHMLNPVLDLFDLIPDFNLRVMTENQNLSQLTAKIIVELVNVFAQYKPDVVFVHGDTTTTLAAAISAYYHRIPIAHVEAGLRTGDINLPWPEEANRKLSGALAKFHFAPTMLSRNNLLHEGVSSDNIHVTGNTVIDALQSIANKIDNSPELVRTLAQQFPYLTPERKLILVTGHRRENFGGGFERICEALAIIACQFPDVDILYPVHLNPSVLKPVKTLLSGINNIHLIEPVDYLPFVYLMKSAYLILTDSGGIQEEAPSLGKPVLVMRDNTERPEALDAGTVLLVGTDVDKIVNQVTKLLIDDERYQEMSQAQNPYGDGKASAHIVQTILQAFGIHKHHEVTSTDEETVC